MQKLTGIFLAILLIATACKKDSHNQLRYYEVGMTNEPVDWRDSSFVVATANAQLIKEIDEQLKLPVAQRKIVNGALEAGSANYNNNSSHSFKWHINENDWNLTEVSIEIYDGRPYSDLDLNPAYWLDTVKRYAPWNSYIKREIDH